LAYVDGDVVPLDEASVSLTDAGLTSGAVVFDTMPLYHGHFFRMDDHLDRFYASLRAVRFDSSFPHAKSELRELVIDVVRRSGLHNATITVMATRGRREPGVPIWEWTPTVIITCLGQDSEPQYKAQWATGARACVSGVHSLPPECVHPQIKHINRLINYFAMLEAADRGVQEAIFRDGEGCVTEGPNFNLFAVRDQRVITPHHGMLRGITRDTLMKIARHHGYEVVEQSLTAYDLYTADEVFITSTNRGAVGLVEIDKRIIGEGKPGPITSQLNDTYWSWRIDSPYALRLEDAVDGAAAGAVR